HPFTAIRRLDRSAPLLRPHIHRHWYRLLIYAALCATTHRPIGRNNRINQIINPMNKPICKPIRTRIGRFWLCSLLALSAFVQVLPAQQPTPVSGVVTDDQAQPLAGVTVTLGGSTQALTTTDESGRFRVTVSDDATLVFSLIGYTATEVSTTGNRQL